MKRYLILFILTGCISFFKCNCDENSPVPPKKISIEELNQTGWAEFSTSRYKSALAYFHEVLVRDSSDISANIGTGWTLLMQDVTSPDQIIPYFRKGIYDDTWKLDAYCGLAILARLDEKSYFEVEPLVNLILQNNPDYFFKYKPTIDWHDLLLIKAQAYFFTKKYELAWQTIQLLTSLYSLDPNSSTTWIINNKQYFTFEAALSKVIEILSNIYKESP